MFSVIIPLYNKAPYIEKAIRSVAAQTCQEFELIVIDDGSNDGGFEIAKELLDALTPPFGGWGVISQSNQGVSVTRNNGVELAKYDYIAFLDADDWWSPTFLEEMKALITQYPEAGIYGSSYFKVKNGKHIPANIGVESGFQHGLINYFQVYAKTMWMPLTSISVVVKKDVFVDINGFKTSLKLGEDFDLWARVALKYPVALLNKPLAYYNQDVDQNSRAVVNEKIYEPSTFVTFNFDFLFENEKSDESIKLLLDKLRVISLLRYRLKGEYLESVNDIINNVDFKNVDIKYYFFYKLPVYVVRIWFDFLKVGSRLKKWISD